MPYKQVVPVISFSFPYKTNTPGVTRRALSCSVALFRIIAMKWHYCYTPFMPQAPRSVPPATADLAVDRCRRAPGAGGARPAAGACLVEVLASDVAAARRWRVHGGRCRPGGEDDRGAGRAPSCWSRWASSWWWPWPPPRCARWRRSVIWR